jgi:hypothetical protein
VSLRTMRPSWLNTARPLAGVGSASSATGRRHGS